jgi:hypothetical protein
MPRVIRFLAESTVDAQWAAMSTVGLGHLARKLGGSPRDVGQASPLPPQVIGRKLGRFLPCARVSPGTILPLDE